MSRLDDTEIHAQSIPSHLKIYSNEQQNNIALTLQRPPAGADPVSLVRYCASLSVNFDALRAELACKQKQYDESQKEISRLMLQNTELQRQVRLLHSAATAAYETQPVDEMKQKVMESKQIESLHERIATLEIRNASLMEENRNLAAQRESLVAAFNTEAERLSSELAQVSVLLSARGSKNKRLTSDLEETHRQGTELAKRIGTLEQELQSVEKQNHELLDSLKEFKIKAEGAQQDRKILQRKIAQIDGEKQELAAQVKSLQERIHERDTQRQADPLQIAHQVADSQREMHEKSLAMMREDFEKTLDRLGKQHEQEIRRLETAAQERQSQEEALRAQVEHLQQKLKYFDAIKDVEQLEQKSSATMRENLDLRRNNELLQCRLHQFEQTALDVNRRSLEMQQALEQQNAQLEQCKRMNFQLRIQLEDERARSAEQGDEESALQRKLYKTQQQLEHYITLNSKLIHKLTKYKRMLSGGE